VEPVRVVLEPVLGLSPDSSVSGVFRPAGSKSLAQRALLFSALARGESEIEGLSDGDDVGAALGVLGGLGVACERLGATRARVTGSPPGAAGLMPRRALDVGESGTLARLLTGALALATAPGARWTIGASGTLLFRRSTPLFAALRSAGVELVRQNLPGTWPVELVACEPPALLELERPLSSQEVSALLFALAAHPEPHELVVRGRIPSPPYLAMTEGVLRLFHAELAATRVGEETRYRVVGPLVAPGAPLVIEPDASSAAVALAAAVLSGGELRVPGLTRASAQGDVRIVEHLCAFGCDARFEADALSARGAPAHGAELDLAGEPDLAPVLAAVAAGAALRVGARSVLGGLATLPGKESDRLGVLARALAEIGLAVEAGTDTLAIGPAPAGSGSPPGVTLDPRGDHRMAFAFALLGLARPGVVVRDPGCVSKSWASFWADLEGLGARLARA